MPRYPRQDSPTGTYHFINRGVNKKRIFHTPDDIGYYLGLIREYKDKLGLEMHHYCIMSNHSHLLLKSPDCQALSRFAHFIQRRYAYYYCKTYHWAEQVFKKRFIDIGIINDSQLMECGRYIERNPLEAKLVDKPEDFRFSSYKHYAFGYKDPLVLDSPVYTTLGNTPAERQACYRFYINQDRSFSLPKDVIKELEAL